MLVLVGKVLKLVRDQPLTQAQKNSRIRLSGKLRTICNEHKQHLARGNMAVLDEANCDYCNMLEEMEKYQ